MNWLERYIEGVKRYLPGKNREDIGEEIMSVLTDKREAEEEKLGHEMDEKELKVWIGAQDHPIIVASGYQKQRELIPSELFPQYLVALKIALFIILGLNVLSAALYILGGGDFHFLGILSRLFGGLIENSLLAFAAITLVFHFLGNHISKVEFFDKWNVENLPQTGHKWLAVPVGELIFEIIAYVFALGVLQVGLINEWGTWWEGGISVNTEVYNLVIWVQVVIVLFLVHRLWLVIRPKWDVAKLLVNIGLTGLGLYVLTMLLNVEPFVFFDPAFVTDHPNIDRDGWLNRSITITLFIVSAVYIYEIGRDLYRIYLLKS